MIKEIVGKRIKFLRKELGLSQEKFAELCGLDRTYITSLENGKRNVSIVTLEKVTKSLNISLKDFFDFNN